KLFILGIIITLATVAHAKLLTTSSPQTITVTSATSTSLTVTPTPMVLVANKVQQANLVGPVVKAKANAHANAALPNLNSTVKPTVWVVTDVTKKTDNKTRNNNKKSKKHHDTGGH
ncbi:hypothetical protein H4R33_006703, partial [Dimargaris cristalligena]